MVTLHTENEIPKETWWAFSPSQGWVLLDQGMPHNRCTDLPEFLEFTRCSDWSTFKQEDQRWDYKEASRYISSLEPRDALAAQQELARLINHYEGQLAA